MSARGVILLREEVDRDALDDAMTATGLVFVHLVPAGPQFPWQLFAAMPDGSASVVFVEDTRLAVAYAAVEGVATETVMAQLERLLGERMLDAPDLSRSLAIAAVGSDLEAALPLLERGFGAPEPETRLYTCLAASYLPHPEVSDLAREVRALESDERVLAALDNLIGASARNAS